MMLSLTMATRAAFALLLSGVAGSPAPPADAEPGAQHAGRGDVVAFVDVAVVPMDEERVLEGQTVIVRDGRIAEIGPAATTPVPAGARRVEGAGRYLMPGLAEMHAHIPGPDDPVEVERTLFLYVANGVTTARGMLGHPSHLELRERAARGELVAPTIVTSGPSFNGNSAPTAEVAEQMVREQQAAGYDFLKIHPGLTREVYDRMAATADEVGIRFAGHVPQDVGLTRALEARQASVDHLDGYVELLLPDGVPEGTNPGFFGYGVVDGVDRARIPDAVEATRRAGVWNVPTQSLIENVFSPEPPEEMARRPDMVYVPPAMLEQWVQAKSNAHASPAFDAERAARFIELRRRLIGALNDAGAGMLLGSDAPQIFNVPGFAIHPEMRMMVESGMTPYEVLRSGTANPAVFFGQPDEFGTVEVGRRADLILLEANPLEDVAHVQRRAGVMVRGRWLPESEIQAGLERIAEAHRASDG